MNDESSVYNNYATHSGGGVYLDRTGHLLMSGYASIHHNRASVGDVFESWKGGGGAFVRAGKLEMSGYSSVHDNTLENIRPMEMSGQGGGGVMQIGCADNIMRDYASIYNNQVVAWAGTPVSGVETTGSAQPYPYYRPVAVGGGGINLQNNATLTMSGSASIHDNDVDGKLYYFAGLGGGVTLDTATLIMNDNVSIYGNSATGQNTHTGGQGGGVYIIGHITGADRGSNYLTRGTLLMNGNAIIYGNTATNTSTPATAQGGGVYVHGAGHPNDGVFQMTGGTVYGSDAHAPPARKNTAYAGAAVYGKTQILRNNAFEPLIAYGDYTLGAWGGMAYVNDLPYAVLTAATPSGTPTNAITLVFDAPVYNLAARYAEYLTLDDTADSTGAAMSGAAVVPGTQNKQWQIAITGVAANGTVGIGANAAGAPHLKPVTLTVPITYP